MLREAADSKLEAPLDSMKAFKQQKEDFMNQTLYPSATAVGSKALVPDAARAVAISRAKLAGTYTSLQADLGTERQNEEPQVMQPSAHQRSTLDLKTIIRLPQFVKLVGLSRSTVYLRLNPKTKYYDPSFPKPIQLGMKAVGWKLEDVYSYIEKLRYRETDL